MPIHRAIYRGPLTPFLTRLGAHLLLPENWWCLVPKKHIHGDELMVSTLGRGMSWSHGWMNQSWPQVYPDPCYFWTLCFLGTLRNGLLKSIYNLWDSIKTIAQTKLAGLWWTTWWRLSAETSKCFIFSGSLTTRPGPKVYSCHAKVPKFVGKWWFFWLVLCSNMWHWHGPSP